MRVGASDAATLAAMCEEHGYRLAWEMLCLQQAGVAATGVAADVGVEIIRNEARRLRIGKIDVALRTELPPEHPALAACLRSFEDFCLVTQSVRQGIEVAVHVESQANPSA